MQKHAKAGSAVVCRELGRETKIGGRNRWDGWPVNKGEGKRDREKRVTIASEL